MNAPIEFLRRIGPDPHKNGRQTIALCNCPDIWELANGDFVVIGIDITDAAKAKLPPTAGCGPDERIRLHPAQSTGRSKARHSELCLKRFLVLGRKFGRAGL